MTPGEIISTSIAGIALIVAWFARLDSKKSAEAAQKSADAAQRANDLMARQLDLVTVEQKRKNEREIAESRPSFVWRGGYAVAGVFKEYNREFQNVGSEIRDVTIESDSADVSVKITSAAFLAKNGSGLATFQSKSSQKLTAFNFSITGTTKLGDRYKELFHAVPEWGEIKISLLKDRDQNDKQLAA